MQSGDHLSISRITVYGTKYWIAHNTSAVTLALVSSLNFNGWAKHEWSVILARVEDWASQIAAARDIWKDFITDHGIPTASSDNIENIPFNVSEREEIRKRLSQIPAQVRERYDLSAEQESGIGHKLDDLIAASERVGKKDWLVMVYGAAFGLIVNDEIPAHIVQGIITMIVTGVAHAFGIGGTPLFIPPRA